jgi:hypothetical protein
MCSKDTRGGRSAAAGDASIRGPYASSSRWSRFETIQRPIKPIAIK